MPSSDATMASQQADRANRSRAQAAVQVAMDRRDNGGDADADER
jgi:hypothetical protein